MERSQNCSLRTQKVGGPHCDDGVCIQVCVCVFVPVFKNKNLWTESAKPVRLKKLPHWTEYHKVNINRKHMVLTTKG